MSHPPYDCENCGVYHIAYSAHVAYANRERSKTMSLFGILFTVALVGIVLGMISFSNHDVDEPVKTMPRPTNMDFGNCMVSTFKPVTMPFVIRLFHEPVKTAEFFEVHENPETIFTSQQTNAAMMFWSHDFDNRYIQVSLEYEKYQSHEVNMEYESGGKTTNILSLKNGTTWCKIFEIQSDQTVKESKNE